MNTKQKFVLVRDDSKESDHVSLTQSVCDLLGVPENKSLLLNTTKGNPGKVGDLPPALSANCEVHAVFRFLANATGTAVPISTNMVSSACGGICTLANANVRSWCSFFKINAITAWAPLSGEVSVNWVNSLGEVKDDVKITTLPTGITVTKGLRFVPPPKTLCGFWLQSALGQNILLLSYSSGSVIDLDVSFTLDNAFVGVDMAVATATLKTAYYGYLDGPTTHQLTPQGRTGTF